MKPKRYILKTATKVIVFVCAMIVAVSIIRSPVITNEVALGQMQNSNENYVLWELYSRSRPMIKILCAGVTLWFTGNIACDTYKFVKNIKNKNEKEKK